MVLNLGPVILNYHDSSRVAVDHLVDNGYQRTAMITLSLSKNVTLRLEQIEGYRKAMEHCRLPVRKPYIKTMETQEVKQERKELLALETQPGAVMAGNDLALMGIMIMPPKKR